MPSNINALVPAAGSQMRAEPIKDNFAAAKTEIETLQGQVSTAQITANTANTTANTANGTANSALQRGGGIMTGEITLPAQAVAPAPGPNQAVTRGYLDLRINEAQSAGGFVPEAPSDADKLYVRSETQWKNIAPATGESTQNVTPAQLQAAINGLPKILNSDVTLNVSAGTWAGQLVIERFTGNGRLQILGPDTVGGKTHAVQQVVVRNCDLREIYIRGIYANMTGNTTKFQVSNCNSFIVFRRCTADTGTFSNPTNIGYTANNTGGGSVFCDTCTATSQNYAFRADTAGVMRINDARGTGNQYIFAALANGTMFVYAWWSISSQYGEYYRFYSAGGDLFPDPRPRPEWSEDTARYIMSGYTSNSMRLGFSGSIWPFLSVGYDVPVLNYNENNARTPPFFTTGVCISSPGRSGSNWPDDPDAPRWNWVSGPEWWEQNELNKQRGTAGKSLFLYACGGTLEGAPGHNPQKVGDPGWIFKIGDRGCIETAQGFTRVFYLDGQAYKPGGGAWENYSDVRLKTNVAEYKAGLAECLKLTPTTFRYNGRGGLRESAKTEIGLSAQDVREVMPEMVGSVKGKIDYDDERDTDILTIDQSPLVFALLNAVKELTGRLAALEVKLDGKNGADD